MWDIQYRKIKKVVEARTFWGGSHMLLTVTRNGAKLSMNGPVYIKFSETEEFILSLNATIKKAQEILEAQ